MKRFVCALATAACLSVPTHAHAGTFEYPAPSFGYTSSAVIVQLVGSLFGMNIGCTTAEGTTSSYTMKCWY